ncbi:MAG: NAD(P)/FAD-dependent oxidoreductase [Campylobacter sp.]
MRFDLVIVGAGASGLFLAANLSGLKVAILEQNSFCGRKILASGGGRCNITNRNICAKNYLGNEEFINEILTKLSFEDVLNFFKELKFKEQKQNQFFCQSGSKDVLNVLLKKARQRAEIFCDTKVVDINETFQDKFRFEILTQNKQEFLCKSVVIATGGISYKNLGVSELGYEMARKFGLEISKLSPALVGFCVQKDEFWFKDLSGVSLKVEIGVEGRKFSSDLLFTHRGVSGPAIFNASLFWQKGQICINFLPNFNFQTLRKSKKQLSTILPLPRSFLLRFLQNFSLTDKPFCEYKKDELEIIFKLQSYKFAPAGTFGFQRAEVTKGGVKTELLDKFCQSLGIEGLFFIGEILDITGMLGGYNLHFAFASAINAAKKINLILK